MSEYYNPSKHPDWLFNPNRKNKFKLSRSKLDLFLNCPRCFYLDNRLGVGRPPGFPFALNSAVDFLLKKEFDLYRAKGESHPLMSSYGIDAIPFQHEKMNEWRDNFRGIQSVHSGTGLTISGAIDDVWTNPKKELHIVDYKSTAKDGEINLDADWQIGYKRQMEIYQWLFRQNQFKVSDTGYFVYANGKKDRQAFDKKLEFEVSIIPYQGDASWVDESIVKAHQCLLSDKVPQMAEECDYCRYREAAGEALR
ncbi:MAG: hypothetical protein COU84_01170 [Candidatus Portnoybacteria bacterium CG10_big_fil_rev_8_21_14_0_10_43_39]|uniref:PD-(D/E)XK endonuclease-like domain-containing protein n=1 Tax=Candidatus Portnoybacteria bacterium CG10_big_fil_rev_8_21_14_0_10_43_39 TaxID=1974815 RepID=A0A2M8KHM2_9BACT|nr:MAG: hypothetical protein COU84_01170 [Candidatus Portnoybacteria bacterium CG10_big_fil_rev_8_21_14_0_10_43_39]